MFSREDQKKLLRFQQAQTIYDLDDKERPDGLISREQLDALNELKSIHDPEVVRLVEVATQEIFLDDLSVEEMKLRFDEIQKALQELLQISIRLKDIRPEFLKQIQ